MLILGIIIGAVSAIGITKTARLVATDGHGRVPTNVYPTMFSIR
jgi:hypothetical protein